jgi:hypothetical protein
MPIVKILLQAMECGVLHILTRHERRDLRRDVTWLLGQAMVLRNHINEARKVILGGRRQAWSRELRVALGNALFSAFVQGFLCEISSATLRPFWITIYVVAGFVGLFLVLWGY